MLSIRSFTLLFTLSLILAVAFQVADARLDTPSARHVPAMHRMLKKRVPVPQTRQGTDNAAGADDTQPPGRVGAQNVAPQPNPADQNTAQSGSSTAAAPTRDSASNTPTRAAATPTVASPSPSATSNTASATPTNGGLVPGLVSGILGGSSSSTTSSTSSSSSSTSVSTSSTSSSSTPLTSSTPSATPTALAETNSVTQITVTSSSTESATPTGSTEGSKSVTKLQRNTIIILVAIGASIGAAGLIWTIIRKWKFRPSSSFEDRMQPIDWQPTMGGASGDRDITEKLNRSASSASHGSFTSGNNNHDHLTADIPQHDFTAGAAHLAPGGGYADLQRGPSPQPDLHAGPNYRSPSPYHYDVPNPHGAYYNNAGGYQGGYDNNRGY